MVCEKLHGVFPEIARAGGSLPATESRLKDCVGARPAGKPDAPVINAYSDYLLEQQGAGMIKMKSANLGAPFAVHGTGLVTAQMINMELLLEQA